MKPLDFILLGLILWSAWSGYKKGLVAEVINTLGLIAGIIAGFMLLDLSVNLIRPFFPKAGVILPVIAFIGVFLFVIWSLRMLAFSVRKILKRTLFGTLDSAAGGAVGILKITFTISTMLWVAGLIGLKLPRHLTNDTYIYPVVATIGPKSLRFLSFLLPFLGDLAAMVQKLFKAK
ncbi:MAG: CvpA family protein [Bacteroidota bacterium]